MKKPSVPSRSGGAEDSAPLGGAAIGVTCGELLGRELGMLGQEGARSGPTLLAGDRAHRVDERRRPGGSRRGPAQHTRLEGSELVDCPAAASPADVRPRLQRAQAAARADRRARRRSGPAGPARRRHGRADDRRVELADATAPACIRAAVVLSDSARRGLRSTASTLPAPSAASCVVFAPGAAHRSRSASPGLGAQRPRHEHRAPRLGHDRAALANSAEPKTSNAPSSTSPSGSPGAGRAHRQLGEYVRAPRDQRVDPQRRLGRAVDRTQERAGRLRPELIKPTHSQPLGDRVSDRGACGVSSRRLASHSAPSRVARRSTALIRPAPAGLSGLTSSTVSSTAAWSATPSRNRIWNRPKRKPASTGGSSRFGGRLTSVAANAVEGGAALNGPVGERGGQRPLARLEARGLRRAARGRRRRPARTPRRTTSRAHRGRGGAGAATPRRPRSESSPLIARRPAGWTTRARARPRAQPSRARARRATAHPQRCRPRKRPGRMDAEPPAVGQLTEAPMWG